MDAIWTTFRHSSREVRPDHATITPVFEPFSPKESICVAENRRIHVLCDDGEEYSQSTSFPIRKIWSYPFGLLIERDCQAAANLFSVDGYPNIFAMSTHLDEPSPVLFLGDDQRKTSDYLQFLRPDCEIAGVGTELPLVLIFDHAKNTHSLWLGRCTTAEEIDLVAELLNNRKDHGTAGLNF